MAIPETNPYIYFMYSLDHVLYRNSVENQQGKKFECGEVVVDGERKKYSFRSTSKTFLSQYIDAYIVAEGNLKNIVYQDCTTPYIKGE